MSFSLPVQSTRLQARDAKVTGDTVRISNGDLDVCFFLEPGSGKQGGAFLEDPKRRIESRRADPLVQFVKSHP